MNRLTEKIALVLVSSSLALFGCTPQQQEAEKLEDDEFHSTAGTSALSGTGSPGSGSHLQPTTHTHYGFPFYSFFNGGGSGVRPGASSFSGRGGSSFSGSSQGGSSRGGFGGSAHGGGS